MDVVLLILAIAFIAWLAFGSNNGDDDDDPRLDGGAGTSPWGM